MATRICCADGNFTTAATWAACDSVGLVDSEQGTQAVGTSNIDSPTFTWGSGAPTVDGVALKFTGRMATPAANTFTVTLRNSTDAVDVDSVTVNVSDIENAWGWYFFNFGASHALIDGKNYIVRLVASAANAVTLHRSTTGTTNFSKALRTTTTGAPAAGDQLLILGEYTAAATKTDRTVTMENNTTDVFGSLTQYSCVGKGGTLTWKNDASTQFYLQGMMLVAIGGTMSIGTSGAGAIGAAYTAKYKFAGTSNVDSGLVVGGTFNAYGATKTVVWTLLTGDRAAGGKILTLAATTDWASGDVVALAPTARTATQYESGTIDTVDSPTQVTLLANVTYAHLGTAPTQGEVVNLTRNVSMFGASATVGGYIKFDPTAVVNMEYVEKYFLGSATANKRGVDIQVTTGSCSIQYSSLHDCTVSNTKGYYVSGSSSNNVTLNYNVVYNVGCDHFRVEATSGTWTITNNVAFGGNSSGHAFHLSDVGGTCTGNRASGINFSSDCGFALTEAAALGTFEHNVAHTCSSNGFLISAAISGGIIHAPTAWRNGNPGIAFVAAHISADLLIDDFTLFGNTGSSINFNNCTIYYLITFKNGVSDSDASFSSTGGLSTGASTCILGGLVLDTCQFGPTVAHTRDLDLSNVTTRMALRIYNTTFTAPTTVVNNSFLAQISPWLKSGIFSMRHNNTDDDHRRWVAEGRARTDAAIYNTAAPSERLIPESASLKLRSGSKQKVVADGATVTFSVYVRKSVTADGGTDPAGADYNGNEPRLILKANSAAGIAADVVLDTMTVAVGNWELLTGTSAAVTDDCVLEAYVDCDGTAGWVNVDDWS